MCHLDDVATACDLLAGQGDGVQVTSFVHAGVLVGVHHAAVCCGEAVVAWRLAHTAVFLQVHPDIARMLLLDGKYGGICQCW